MMVYPLKMRPYFRHGDETPWGGERLRTLFGKSIPDDRTGESLEISALPGRESVVDNGDMAGRTLSQVAQAWGADLLGKWQEFPLLLKLLDARDTLSVQVHPDDDYARRVEGKRGKTEAWYILDTQPGAKLVYGVNARDKAELERLSEAGRIEDALNWISVKPGDCLYIRSGTVHAIGAGIVLYEIQQSSDVTYRMWDWGRPREIHTRKALDVTRCDMELTPVTPKVSHVLGGHRAELIDGEFFRLSRLDVMGRMPVETDSFALLTALDKCWVEYDGGSLLLERGDSALIPAALGEFSLCGHLTALLSEPAANS